MRWCGVLGSRGAGGAAASSCRDWKACSHGDGAAGGTERGRLWDLGVVVGVWVAMSAGSQMLRCRQSLLPGQGPSAKKIRAVFQWRAHQSALNLAEDSLFALRPVQIASFAFAFSSSTSNSPLRACLMPGAWLCSDVDISVVAFSPTLPRTHHPPCPRF